MLTMALGQAGGLIWEQGTQFGSPSWAEASATELLKTVSLATSHLAYK